MPAPGVVSGREKSDEPPTFGKLDIRVGKIVEAWEHPDSEKLWVEKIDVGDEGGEPRQIASGLRAHYATAADLEGREVIVVCNLKEAKLGGVPWAMRDVDSLQGRVELPHCMQTAMPNGNSPILLLNEAANRIGRGESRICAVAGGEALRAAHRLKVDAEAKVVLEVGGDAVVADQRERERENLPTVRRVGQRLRVADHGRVEDHLTRGRALSTKGESLEPCAVTQHEGRLSP